MEVVRRRQMASFFYRSTSGVPYLDGFLTGIGPLDKRKLVFCWKGWLNDREPSGPIRVLVGHPGSGKSMMSRRLPSILPVMSLEEALHTTRIYSVAGRVQQDHGLVSVRPFRMPHHSSSEELDCNCAVNKLFSFLAMHFLNSDGFSSRLP